MQLFLLRKNTIKVFQWEMRMKEKILVTGEVVFNEKIVFQTNSTEGIAMKT